MQRVAMLSVHTSPLAQPGAGDGGGMNVYVRALASALARAGVAVDVLTRAEHPEQPPCIDVEPGFRVLHVPAGPCAPVPLRDLPALVGEFTDAAREVLTRAGGHDVLHANYWVSGAIGHRLKHELDLPLVTTFHTLERVKAEVGLGDDVPLRPRVEAEVVRCADLVVASTREEHDQLVRHYGADPERIEIITPGVDHTVFSPGDRARARRHVGLTGGPVLLFVGRIQPLKGADLAVRALAEVHDRHAQLVVIGGPSGPDGVGEVEALHALVTELGVEHRVHFVAPQPHDQLVEYYRAADVCVVPSRTESFGLVALEAAACGTPVVAANVGGLRLLVDDGATGFLVDERDPAAYAASIDRVLREECGELGTQAYARSTRYRWSIAAARLRRHYDDLTARDGQVQLELEQAHALVATHLEGPVAAESYIQTVEYDPELRRWYVRFTCDGRDATTIYFDLHERTLRYEVYFLPLPPEHHLELYEFLLKRNHSMYGARFSLGPDGDVYLVGRVALEHLTVEELDRIIGVLYELTERWFQPLVKLAYGDRTRPGS